MARIPEVEIPESFDHPPLVKPVAFEGSSMPQQLFLNAPAQFDPPSEMNYTDFVFKDTFGDCIVVDVTFRLKFEKRVPSFVNMMEMYLSLDGSAARIESHSLSSLVILENPYTSDYHMSCAFLPSELPRRKDELKISLLNQKLAPSDVESLEIQVRSLERAKMSRIQGLQRRVKEANQFVTELDTVSLNQKIPVFLSLFEEVPLFLQQCVVLPIEFEMRFPSIALLSDPDSDLPSHMPIDEMANTFFGPRVSSDHALKDVFIENLEEYPVVLKYQLTEDEMIFTGKFSVSESMSKWEKPTIRVPYPHSRAKETKGGEKKDGRGGGGDGSHQRFRGRFSYGGSGDRGQDGGRGGDRRFGGRSRGGRGRRHGNSFRPDRNASENVRKKSETPELFFPYVIRDAEKKEYLEGRLIDSRVDANESIIIRRPDKSFEIEIPDHAYAFNSKKFYSGSMSQSQIDETATDSHIRTLMDHERLKRIRKNFLRKQEEADDEAVAKLPKSTEEMKRQARKDEFDEYEKEDHIEIDGDSDREVYDGEEDDVGKDDDFNANGSEDEYGETQKVLNRDVDIGSDEEEENAEKEKEKKDRIEGVTTDTREFNSLGGEEDPGSKGADQDDDEDDIIFPEEDEPASLTRTTELLKRRGSRWAGGRHARDEDEPAPSHRRGKQRKR
jgi:hypothetical protein